MIVGERSVEKLTDLEPDGPKVDGQTTLNDWGWSA